MRRHVRAGIGDAHEQSRGCSDLGLGQSVRHACNQYQCWSRPNYYRGSSYYGYGYGSYYGYGYPAYYGYYALRSEPGFYRRPYYGYYRGY